MTRRFAERRKFLALRACWMILRGGSVAYRINFTDGGGEGLTSPTYFTECEMDGEPLAPEHIWHEGQERWKP